jgi:hypothetical protein
MRIISVLPAPVARIFAIVYGVCGLGAFLQYAFSNMQSFILPFGLFMGVFHFNLNFHLRRSPDLLANTFLCFGSIFSHALSGWITGAAIALGFNFVAEKTGGVDAKFVITGEDPSPSPATLPLS